MLGSVRNVLLVILFWPDLNIALIFDPCRCARFIKPALSLWNKRVNIIVNCIVNLNLSLPFCLRKQSATVAVSWVANCKYLLTITILMKTLLVVARSDESLAGQQGYDRSLFSKGEVLGRWACLTLCQASVSFKSPRCSVLFLFCLLETASWCSS